MKKSIVIKTIFALFALNAWAAPISLKVSEIRTAEETQVKDLVVSQSRMMLFVWDTTENNTKTKNYELKVSGNEIILDPDFIKDLTQFHKVVKEASNQNKRVKIEVDLMLTGKISDRLIRSRASLYVSDDLKTIGFGTFQTPIEFSGSSEISLIEDVQKDEDWKEQWENFAPKGE